MSNARNTSDSLELVSPCPQIKRECETLGRVKMIEYAYWKLTNDQLHCRLSESERDAITKHLQDGCIMCDTFLRNASIGLDGGLRVIPEAKVGLSIDAVRHEEADRYLHAGRVGDSLQACSDEADRILSEFGTSSQVRSEADVLDAITLLYKSRRYADARSAIAQFGTAIVDTDSIGRLQKLDDVCCRADKLFGFADLVAKRVENRCRRNLHRLLCEIQERFRATSAWLFLLEGDELVSYVEQNTNKRRLRLRLGQGMVGHVAQTRHGHCARDVALDDFYLELVSHTRSEIAVPIIASDGRLLGVLNLESHLTGTFADYHIWELQALVGSMVADILLLGDDEAMKIGLEFNQGTGWGISDLLEEFLFHACHTLGEDDITFSIWHMDWEKEELWVRATAGFDAEYIGLTSLPADGSLMGHVCNRMRGTVVQGHWRDLPTFLRRDKARWMGLTRVHAIPIYKPGEQRALGCLNSYSFFAERVIPEDLLRHIADHVGQLFSAYERLQPQIAAASFAEAMAKRKKLSSDAAFEVMKQSIMEYLNAEACSIFALRPRSTELECTATTGLEKDGDRVFQPSSATYDLSGGPVGFTTLLGTHVGACVRKNDLPNENEQLASSHYDDSRVKAQKKYVESFVLTETDHRRFLAGSVGTDDGGLLGVVRVLRPSRSRPFVKSDEVLLTALLTESRRVFLEWQDARALSGYVRSARRRLLSQSPRLSGPQQRAFDALIRPVAADYGSNRSLVDDVLQNILIFFQDAGAIQASVRAVIRGPAERSIFRLFAYHSVRSFHLPDEMKYPPVTQEQGSVAWRALQKWRILTFKRTACRQLFKPIHEESDRVESGVAIPLITWTGGKCVKWALCIDFDTVVDWDSIGIETLLHVARKLSAILSDSAPPVFLPPTHFLRGFVATGVRSTGADWGHLRIRCDDSDLEARMGRMVQMPTADEWEPVDGPVGEYAAGDFSVCVDKQTGRIFRVPLLFGPFEVGHLTCGSSSTEYNHGNKIAIGQIVKYWSSLTGFPGKTPSHWNSQFDSVGDTEFDGIEIWSAKPVWEAPMRTRQLTVNERHADLLPTSSALTGA